MYNGTDELWASIMENLWTSVEDEYGKKAAHFHRERIALAGERPGNTSPPKTRMKKRQRPWWKFKMEFAAFTIFSVTGITLGLSFLDIFDFDEDVSRAGS